MDMYEINHMTTAHVTDECDRRSEMYSSQLSSWKNKPE